MTLWPSPTHAMLRMYWTITKHQAEAGQCSLGIVIELNSPNEFVWPIVITLHTNPLLSQLWPQQNSVSWHSNMGTLTDLTDSSIMWVFTAG